MNSAVVIGIPTYRRPALLARLLQSLTPEIADRDVLVIIGDNEAGTAAPAVAAESELDTLCVPVEAPGIPEVRNALIRTALQERPAWEHLIMLDDDGYVAPGWFDALMDGVARYHADVTAGPVLGELPPDASRLARNSIYAGRRRSTSGPVDMLNGTQNIAISRHIVEAIGDPWFPVHLGRSGGEDHFFFREVLDQGGTMAWCDEAAVTEPTPAARLRADALLRRAFRSNMVSTQTDLAFYGPVEVTRRLAADTGRFGRKVAAGVVRRDPDRLASAAIDAVSLMGRTSGFVRRTPPNSDHTGI